MTDRTSRTEQGTCRPLTPEERLTHPACRFCLSGRCDECCYAPEEVAEGEQDDDREGAG